MKFANVIVVKDNFSAKEFIEQLSKNQAGLASSTEGMKKTLTLNHIQLTAYKIALDPRPYIRTFEAALQQLKQIQSKVSKEEVQAAADASKTEIRHCNSVIDISQKFQVCFWLWC